MVSTRLLRHHILYPKPDMFIQRRGREFNHVEHIEERQRQRPQRNRKRNSNGAIDPDLSVPKQLGDRD